MPTANESIVAASGLATVVVAGYTAFTGYRAKGKDQHLARETTSYDNLQEDLREKRGEVAALKEEVRAERARADGYHGELIAQQDVRHELRSIARTALELLREHGVPHEGLRERVRSLDGPGRS